MQIINYKNLFLLLFFLISFMHIGNTQVNTKLDKVIKIEKPNLSILSLLQKIENESKLKITYSIDYFDIDQNIEICKNDCTIRYYFDLIAKSQGLKLIVNDDNIYLIKNYSLSSNSNDFRFSGYVKDAETNELLIGATIRVESDNIGIITDENGYFNVNIRKDIDSILISYIGYSPLKIGMNSSTGSFKSEYLLHKSNVLNDILINSYSKNDDVLIQDFEFSKNTIKMDLKSSTIGNNDVLKSLTIFPGIEKNNDFQNGISINGLSPEDNIYMLDGARIYEPNHIFGLFSSFNNTSINKVSVYSNEIPLKYIGAFSSIIDSHLKEGSVQKHKLHFDMSNSYVGVFGSGPILKNKTSYIADIRKSILGLYIPSILKDNLGVDFNRINFYDANIKITHKIKPGNKFSFFLYNGKDDIEINKLLINNLASYDTYNWNNLAYGMHWEYLLKENLNSKINFSVSKYSNNSRTRIDFENNEGLKKYFQIFSKTDIRDITFQQDIKYYYKTNFNWKIGYSISKYNLSPHLKGDISENIIEPDIKIETIKDSIYYSTVAYVSGDYFFKTNLKISGGAQIGFIFNNGKTKKFVNPLFSIGQKVSRNSYISLNYERTSKFIHSLGSYSIGIPAMLWTFSNDDIPISFSESLSLNFNYRKNLIDLKSDIYYKSLKDILEFKDIADIYSPITSSGIVVPVFSTNSSIQDLVKVGNGTAYGINSSLTYNSINWKIIGAFSINRTKLNFENINRDKTYYGKYDMPFSSSLYIEYKLNNVQIYSNLHFHSGQLFSLPSHIYKDINGTEILDYSNRNNERMGKYISLSLGSEYEFKSKNITAKISGGVSNILNNFNPVYVYIFKESNKYKASQVSGIPIFPYLKVSISI